MILFLPFCCLPAAGAVVTWGVGAARQGLASTRGLFRALDDSLQSRAFSRINARSGCARAHFHATPTHCVFAPEKPGFGRGRAGAKEKAMRFGSLNLEAASRGDAASRAALQRPIRPAAPARRQVDLASRSSSACSASARRRSRACSKATTCCAPRSACRALGATVERRGEGRWRVAGAGSARCSRRARRSTSATPAPARG